MAVRQNGTVPVLVMNPSGKRTMARARSKTTSRKTTRRAPARRRPARKGARKTTTRRRRVTRRKNPKIDPAGVALAVAGGAVIGGAGYAIDGQDLSPTVKTAIVGIGAAALALAVSMANHAVGAGIAGAGAALAVKSLLEQYMAGQAATAGMGRIPNYAYQKFGNTPARPAYRHLPQGLDAVTAQLDSTSMDAVVADLDAVEAELIGLY